MMKQCADPSLIGRVPLKRAQSIANRVNNCLTPAKLEIYEKAVPADDGKAAAFRSGFLVLEDLTLLGKRLQVILPIVEWLEKRRGGKLPAPAAELEAALEQADEKGVVVAASEVVRRGHENTCDTRDNRQHRQLHEMKCLYESICRVRVHRAPTLT